MRNILFTLFAIALAGVAAIAATTAMLNSPAPKTASVLNIGAPTPDKPAGTTPPANPTDVPAPPGGPAPAPIPDADKPATGGASKPAEEPGAAKSDPSTGAAKPAGEPGKEEPEEDEDPYEGIAPEDLPPDLQYDADSSVSFPTNT